MEAQKRKVIVSSSSGGGGGGGGGELPHDVVNEILKRLPLRSLVRFRCVSRSWRSTIDDPHFFPRHRYLAYIHWENGKEHLCSLIPDQSLACDSPLQVEIPFFASANSYRIVGSCDGLIFVEAIPKAADSDQTMYLWNPFTRNHKAVPQQRFSKSVVYEVLGLGFDARSNDYKIVKILYFKDQFDRIKSRAEIYSLHTDSWRSLKPKTKFPTLRRGEPGVFFNGKLHWFATIGGGEGQYRLIISFDVADEVVNEIALPPVQISVNLQMYMAVLGNSLAVAVFMRTEDFPRHSNCSVWVLKDYRSWIRRTFEFDGKVTDKVDFHGEVTGLDGFTRNGELLINRDGDRVSVNLTTGQYTALSILTPDNLVSVVESLMF